MPGPYLDDYGGNRYGRRYRTQKRKENVRSYRCLDCGKLSYFSHRQASCRVQAPRCTDCGGALEETEPSLKRRGIKKGKIPELIGNVGLECKRYQCRFCRRSFRSAVGLKLHEEEVEEGWHGT